MPAARKPGRPLGSTKLDEALLDKVREGIMLRAQPFSTACLAVGIAYSTSTWWCRKGENSPGSIYGRFLALKQHAADLALSMLYPAMKAQALKGNTKAAELLFKAHDHRGFVLRRIELTGEDGGPVELLDPTGPRAVFVLPANGRELPPAYEGKAPLQLLAGEVLRAADDDEDDPSHNGNGDRRTG